MGMHKKFQRISSKTTHHSSSRSKYENSVTHSHKNRKVEKTSRTKDISNEAEMEELIKKKTPGIYIIPPELLRKYKHKLYKANIIDKSRNVNKFGNDVTPYIYYEYVDKHSKKSSPIKEGSFRRHKEKCLDKLSKYSGNVALRKDKADVDMKVFMNKMQNMFEKKIKKLVNLEKHLISDEAQTENALIKSERPTESNLSINAFPVICTRYDKLKHRPGPRKDRMVLNTVIEDKPSGTQEIEDVQFEPEAEDKDSEKTSFRRHRVHLEEYFCGVQYFVSEGEDSIEKKKRSSRFLQYYSYMSPKTLPYPARRPPESIIYLDSSTATEAEFPATDNYSFENNFSSTIDKLEDLGLESLKTVSSSRGSLADLDQKEKKKEIKQTDQKASDVTVMIPKNPRFSEVSTPSNPSKCLDYQHLVDTTFVKNFQYCQLVNSICVTSDKSDSESESSCVSVCVAKVDTGVGGSSLHSLENKSIQCNFYDSNRFKHKEIEVKHYPKLSKTSYVLFDSPEVKIEEKPTEKEIPNKKVGNKTAKPTATVDKEKKTPFKSILSKSPRKPESLLSKPPEEKKTIFLKPEKKPEKLEETVIPQKSIQKPEKKKEEPNFSKNQIQKIEKKVEPLVSKTPVRRSIPVSQSKIKRSLKESYHKIGRSASNIEMVKAGPDQDKIVHSKSDTNLKKKSNQRDKHDRSKANKISKLPVLKNSNLRKVVDKVQVRNDCEKNDVKEVNVLASPRLGPTSSASSIVVNEKPKSAPPKNEAKKVDPKPNQDKKEASGSYFKRKSYGEDIRRRMKETFNKAKIIPPPVMEVRYMTSCNIEDNLELESKNFEKPLNHEENDKQDMNNIKSNSENLEDESTDSEEEESEDSDSGEFKFIGSVEDCSCFCLSDASSEPPRKKRKSMEDILIPEECFELVKIKSKERGSKQHSLMSCPILNPVSSSFDFLYENLTTPKESLKSKFIVYNGENTLTQNCFKEKHSWNFPTLPNKEESGYSSLKHKNSSFFKKESIAALFKPPSQDNTYTVLYKFEEKLFKNPINILMNNNKSNLDRRKTKSSPSLAFRYVDLKFCVHFNQEDEFCPNSPCYLLRSSKSDSSVSSAEYLLNEKDFFEMLLAAYDREMEFFDKLAFNRDFYKELLYLVKSKKEVKNKKNKMVKYKFLNLFKKKFKTLGASGSDSIEGSLGGAPSSVISFSKRIEGNGGYAKHCLELKSVAAKVQKKFSPLVQALLVNRRSDQRFAGFLRVLQEVESGDFSFLKRMNCLEIVLPRLVKESFFRCFELANEEAKSLGRILLEENIFLLYLLVTKFRVCRFHREISKLIGQGAIPNEIYLEFLVKQVVRFDHEDVDLEEFWEQLR